MTATLLRHPVNGSTTPVAIPQSPITATVMQVTPDIAGDWLARPSDNRRVHQGKVAEYASAMRRGQWHLNGEAIKLDTNGLLVDGQHRCIAIVQSGVTITSLVVTGLAPIAFNSLDSGKPRSAADVLRRHGYTNEARLASATRIILMLDWYNDVGRNGRALTPSKDQILAAVQQFPGIVESCTRVRAAGFRKLHCPESLLGALHFVFSNIDADDTAAFFDQLELGASLPEQHPIFVLRERLLRIELQRNHPEREVAAFIIKAWNAYRDGRSITQLRFTPGGAKPELFPIPH